MTLVAPSPSLAQIGRPSDGALIYVRDQIVVNDALTTELKAQIAHRGVEPGGRLTLIAREIVHEPKYVLRLEGFPLLLVADTYNANGGAVDTSGRAGANGAPGGIGKQGLAAQNTRHDGGDGGDGAAGSTGTAAVPLTLIARTIIDAGLVARGGAGGSGGAGGRGGAGGDGRHGVPGRFEGFEGTDGGQGGNGGRGGAGGAAARVTIHYVTSHQALRLDGRGGSAGAGGPAGAGGAGGKILGKAGPARTTGTKGATGASVLPAPHPQGEPYWWKTVLDTAGASAARRWAEHRTRMGEYLFRTGDRAKALVEFQAAMRLAPDHAAEARRLAQYITANQTPLGISYDHDLIPDFRHYEDVVTDYGPMIQELLSVATTMLLEASDVSANRERLEGEQQRLEHLQAALVTDIVGANAGLSHAEGEVELADTRIRQLENRITALEKAMRQEQMDDFDVLGTLWDVAVAVVAVAGAIYTGGATLGALASAAGLLANAENVLHSGLWDEQTGTFDGSYLLEFKKTKAYKDMVGGFEELVQQGKSFYDKAKVIGGLFDAKVGGERTNEHKDLVQQLAELTFERNLLELTRMQADLALEAASQRKQAANEDNAFLSAQIDALGSDVAIIARVAQRLITSAQTYVDLYTRYAFFAARALELWTLRPRTAGYSFALGYLHPDREAHAFAAAERGQARRLLALLEEYVPSISDLPSPLHLRDAYETYTSELNTFRQYWNITDATVLDELRQHGRTSVRIPLDTIGANRIELKIEQLYLSLVGAAAVNDTVMVEVEHSGHASNRRRTRGEVVISDTIAPPRRSTVAASLDESLVEIEDQQQFWGRSPAALWRLAVDPTRSPGLDLSGMNELQIVIDYRYVPIG